MATVLEPATRTSDRIRHPLQAVRSTIRTYVLLESAALAVVCLAAWFWIGLALDWGVFALFSYDWVQELQYLDPSRSVAFYIRLVVLLGVLGLLVALAVTKVVMRLSREFSDAAVALVLERRFPAELGDRLITAVEMADPAQAAQLGYSRPMVEKTIQEAGQRVGELPVSDVFDWGRLRRQWLVAGLVTVGLLVAVVVVGSGLGMATGSLSSPLAILGPSYDVGATWTERNVLLQDSYWPRRAHLEVVRFLDTPSHPGEMRVGRDEQRPDLLVRSVQWVVADRSAPAGWRALRWSDLPRFLPQEVIDSVTIPADYGGWIVDVDDLPLDPATASVLAAWQGKTSGDVRRELAQPGPATQGPMHAASRAIAEWLDWRQWTMDKIDLQEKRPEVRQPLREKHMAAHQALEDVFSRLDALSESSSMSRTLRKLATPTRVEMVYRGETMKTTNTAEAKAAQTFAVDLNELKESGRLRVRAEDFWTRPLQITLVPPPSVIEVKVDKEEPAYIYHRLQGKQAPLKGKKQVFSDFAVSATGEATTIDVPIGSNLTLKVKVDRALQEGIYIRPPGPGQKETGSIVPDAPATRVTDATGYTIRLENIARLMEFVVEYSDDDNVKGRRRFRIRPIDDQPPEIISVELAAVLRKPRFKAEPGKTGGGLSIDGYLITPDALVPFLGGLRDDYGLTRAEWIFEAEQVDFQLAGTGTGAAKDRSGFLLSQGNPRARRSGLIASALQYHPASLQPAASLAYWGWVRNLFDAAAKNAGAGEETVPMEAFLRRLEERSIDEIPLSALAQKLQERPLTRSRLKEHQLKDEDGFDVRKHLAGVKPKDPGKDVQQLFFLRLSVAATDNNIETGPSTSRTKAPFFFIIVAENDLLVQIAMEEEVLAERLEKVMEKFNGAKISIIEQTSKLMSSGDLSLIGIRADEIRKAVLDGASVSREVHTDCVRILRELEVNRVRRLKIDDMRQRIVLALEDIVNPNFGEFQAAEEASQRFYQAIDDDLAAKRAPNLETHQAQARQTRDHVERLMSKLNDVLIAMGEGIVEAKIIESLLRTEEGQRRIAEQFRRFHDERVRDLLEELTQPKKKK